MAVKMEKIDWRKPPTIREIVVFAVVLLFMFVGFLQVLLDPQKAAMKKVQADLKVAKQQEESFVNLLKAIDQKVEEKKKSLAQEQKKNLNDRYERLLNYRPADQTQEVTQVASLLSSRKLMRGITLKTITIGETKEFKGYSIAPLDILVEGRYSGILKYLDELEQFDRPVFVNHIDITEDPRSGFLVANLSVELYLLGLGES